MIPLEPSERLRLLQFVCSFAWTDLKVSDEERAVIRLMASHPDFSAKDRAQVESWLERPPPVDEVDPTTIPHAHRELFLDAARSVVEVDGQVRGSERDALELFEELLRTS